MIKDKLSEVATAISSRTSRGSFERRWGAAITLLDMLRLHPGSTRAGAAKRVGIGSGTAAQVVGRLRALHLLDEVPAPAVGRGRPTTTLRPHPLGPLVVVIDIRHEDWRGGIAGLDGLPVVGTERSHIGQGPDEVVSTIRSFLRSLRRRHGFRLQAVSVSVSGTVRNGRLAQLSTLGWATTDLSSIAGPTGVPFVVGNDATLAGLAESRTGAASGATAALHLTVEVGIGGVLVVDGVPVTGSGGAGGEFGHLPFGDPKLRCPCGARGCWDLEVDGRALARHLGAPEPDDPRGYARSVLADSPGNRGTQSAVRRVAAALGRGTAGLVNAHDPDVVTLGGLAPLLAAQSGFARAFEEGLMRFRRPAPPPIQSAAFGERGSLVGAAAAGLDLVVSEPGLDRWEAGVRAGLRAWPRSGHPIRRTPGLAGIG